MMREISEFIFEITTLEKLDLSRNKITTFPNIDKPINLKELDLSFNRLRFISSSIRFLSSLKTLSINDNSLSGFLLSFKYYINYYYY